MLGHSDRLGLRDDEASHSWNSSHPSRGPDGGCSEADLPTTGGAELFYCFAVNLALAVASENQNKNSGAKAKSEEEAGRRRTLPGFAVPVRTV